MLKQTEEIPNYEIEQVEKLISIIQHSPEMLETLLACAYYGLPNFYIAGGSITQMIWNHQLGLPLLSKVKDFDIIYFSKEESQNAVTHHQAQLQTMVNHQVELDVTNQAHVHLWYGEKFGNDIQPFTRTEDGIDTWLSAFAIGVSIDTNDKWRVYAPYGLSDAFNKMIKPNKLTMSNQNYATLTESYKNRWLDITISPWLDNVK